MALPWWLRGALTGGAALLKKRLKGKGEELVGEARKKAIAKLAKKQKNGKKEKPKKKDTMSRKELMEHGKREAKREKKKLKIDDIEDEFIKAQRNVEKPFRSYGKNAEEKQKKAVDAYHKAEKRMKDRTRMAAQDMKLRRRTGGGGGRSEHSITGQTKGDTDLLRFSNSLLKHDVRVARNVTAYQKLKKIRDYLKKQNIKKYTSPKGKTSKDIQQLVKKYEIDPKLAKPAKESFKRIQKKKDRFKKKDAKKKGKQGD